jgi:hypothetical protein
MYNFVIRQIKLKNFEMIFPQKKNLTIPFTLIDNEFLYLNIHV